ncbi:MAG: hypothetical protein O2857_27795 [Planctomycetota bacterium]|nr:hypothetical protein [Planctomycetota bacterium]
MDSALNSYEGACIVSRSKSKEAAQGGCSVYDKMNNGMKRYKKQLQQDTAAARTAANRTEAGEETDEASLADKMRPNDLD